MNVLVVVAEAELVAVNVLVPMSVRGYESEGKWMFLFRDMLFVFFVLI